MLVSGPVSEAQAEDSAKTEYREDSEDNKDNEIHKETATSNGEYTRLISAIRLPIASTADQGQPVVSEVAEVPLPYFIANKINGGTCSE
jgi:hypothetical protein